MEKNKQLSFDELIANGVSENDAKLQTAVFFIEATSFEKHCLWKENHEKIEWEEDLSGGLKKIGDIGDNRQVWVTFNYAKLFGKRVCFYEITSRYADHDMMRNYLITNYPVKYNNNSNFAITDAQNFHLAIHACKNYK